MFKLMLRVTEMWCGQYHIAEKSSRCLKSKLSKEASALSAVVLPNASQLRVIQFARTAIVCVLLFAAIPNGAVAQSPKPIEDLVGELLNSATSLDPERKILD